MRDRLTLRTILIATSLVAVVMFALVFWVGGGIIAFARARSAEQQLESRGFYVVGSQGKNIEWSHYFRSGNRLTVHAPMLRFVILGPKHRAPFQPTDWKFIDRLGPLRELNLVGPECDTPACYECLRKNKGSLEELTLVGCTLSPELGRALGECTQLRSLRFGRTQNDRQPMKIAPLPNLQAVVFKQALVVTPNLTWLADQPALERLLLSGSVTDQGLGIILRCESLQGVDLGETSISREGMQRLLAEGKFLGLTYSPVFLDEDDVAALVKSRLQRIGLQHAQVAASLTPLLECERVEQLAVSLPQFEKLIAEELNLTRENKLKLDVHGLTQFRDVSVNPWSSCVELRRFDEYGGFMGERIATEYEE